MRKTVVAFVLIGALIFGTITTAGAVNRAKKRRPGPTRVLLLGDSFVAHSQTRTAELIGSGYQVIGAGAGGTGLLDVGVCKGERGQKLAALYDPDIVVIEYTGNYEMTGTTPCDSSVVYGSKQFYASWKLAAKATAKAFTSKGATVIWVLSPAGMPGARTAALVKINDTYRTISKVPPIDAYTSFGGATYNASLHDPDGLHPSTPAGYDLLSQQTAYRVRQNS